MIRKEKILVILGPTASGKSDLAVELAKEFNGEIISADSRQVYKGLNIGSGKITKREMKNITHHLLDVVQPQTVFTVVKFQKLVGKIIKDILTRGKLPIICGGTGFYIQSVIEGVVFPKIKPDLNLRSHLETRFPSELFMMLQKLDPERAKIIDAKNPRRLIRAIEISNSLRSPTTKFKPLGGWASKWEVLQVGIKTDKEILEERIERRFLVRVRQGIVAEAKTLHRKGLTYKRFSEIGLAHRYLALFLRKKISKEEFIKKSIKAEQKYAKRQVTWFKRDKRIKWFKLAEVKKIRSTITTFLFGNLTTK